MSKNAARQSRRTNRRPARNRMIANTPAPAWAEPLASGVFDAPSAEATAELNRWEYCYEDGEFDWTYYFDVRDEVQMKFPSVDLTTEMEADVATDLAHDDPMVRVWWV